MVAVKPDMIRRIDQYAEEKLGIPTDTLMQRAGEAVFKCVQTKVNKKSPRVLVLCGGGNNGGDGYAAAKLMLEHGMRVCAVDLFAAGQRTEEGKRALAAYLASPDARMLYGTEDVREELFRADCVVEAVFGVGARESLPEEALWLLRTLHEVSGKRLSEKGESAFCVSVDCPLGINAENGTAHEDAFFFDATVELSFPKIGTHSYPAARYAGEFFYDSLGLPIKEIKDNFHLQDIVMDGEDAKKLRPLRLSEGHKGSFGTLLSFTGSRLYRGAALLAAEAALRGGIGLLRYVGEDEVCDALLARTPEAVCHRIAPIAPLDLETAQRLVDALPRADAVLVGSGCGRSEGLANLLRVLLLRRTAPTVLDADALNVLSDPKNDLFDCFSFCKGEVLLTPHPQEFARLIGKSVEEVQKNRLALARAFAERYEVTVLLKGKGSVIAAPDGRVCVNTSGNTALSKGGSGDVLAGLVASYVAQGLPVFEAAALGAYLHGRAGEVLAETLGEAGVLPSDLPLQIAKEAQK